MGEEPEVNREQRCNHMYEIAREAEEDAAGKHRAGKAELAADMLLLLRRRFEVIEMNTMLSTPSTISKKMSVTRLIHASGLAKMERSTVVVSFSVPAFSSKCSGV